MNSNQRSQRNNQTSNGGNEKKVSSARGGSTENYSRQSSAEGTGLPGGGSKQSGTKGITPHELGSGQGLHAQSSGGGEGAGMQPQGQITGGQAQPAERGLEGAGQSLGSDDLQRQAGGQRRGSSGEQSWQSASGAERTGSRQGVSPTGSNERPPKAGGGGELSGRGQGAGSQQAGGAGAGLGAAGSGANPPSRHTGDAEWGMTENRPRQSDSGGGPASQQMAPGSRQLSGSTDSQNVDSTSRQGSQTGNQAYDDVGTQRYSNDSAGGLPRSPAGSRQSAETDMNDATGLSNSANLQRQDLGTEQEKRRHEGRRDDLTED